MKSSSLKQTELFALIAMTFIIVAGAVYVKKSAVSETLPIDKLLPSSLYPSVIEIPGGAIFEKGTAIPSGGYDQLKQDIKKTVIPDIERKQANNKELDMIEVIGHTDGEPIDSSGNLDRYISEVANGSKPPLVLSPGSNADLGLMRALVILRIIEELAKSGECKCKIVARRAYSAGQLFASNGTSFAPSSEKSDQNRRRFEVKLTKWVGKETVESLKP